MSDDSATAVLARDPRSLLSRIVRVTSYVASIDAGSGPENVGPAGHAEVKAIETRWRERTRARYLDQGADEGTLDALLDGKAGGLLVDTMRRDLCMGKAAPTDNDVVHRTLVGAFVWKRGSLGTGATALTSWSPSLGSEANARGRPAVLKQVRREVIRFLKRRLRADGVDVVEQASQWALDVAVVAAMAISTVDTISRKILLGELLDTYEIHKRAALSDAQLQLDIGVGVVRLLQIRANLLAGRSPFAPAAPKSGPTPSPLAAARAVRGRPPKTKLAPRIARQLETA
ncbi:hypothetical protein JOD31_001713 [Methylopila capsulata]|uniref:Uncharacterized protein n=1 Tax=Methylopila capsulata TaxID=61654 RepID=A0A9W6ISZ8_9HYPH|nr:hypothetical protein [Methylopila capsulata]MBM7851488.1 hypothetical protein [Methylopila capsulata]GLK54546.1 hypothetical protein GCM10008170_05650 [Methylopila capsulata]